MLAQRKTTGARIHLIVDYDHLGRIFAERERRRLNPKQETVQ